MNSWTSSHLSPSIHSIFLVSVLLAGLVLAGAPAAQAGDGITLRVNDAKGLAGSVVAVEVRTYAPRGVGQGQICLRSADTLTSSSNGSSSNGSSSDDVADGTDSGLSAVRLAGGEGLSSLALPANDLPESPFAALEGVVVLSALGDSVSSATFDAGTQTALVDFSSPSSTINNADGALAVFYFRLRDDLEPDQEFQLVLDPGVTFLVDEGGNNVPLELKGGRLRIDKPDNDCTTVY